MAVSRGIALVFDAQKETLPLDSEIVNYQDYLNTSYLNYSASGDYVDDIFVSARRGDLEKVTYFTEVEGVKLNQRDQWDGTPLYYACLGGHPHVVQYLLDKGARCQEGTFDGERCLYAAHTQDIRKLLREFKQVATTHDRHDPYSTFLRALFAALSGGVYTGPRLKVDPDSDVTFILKKDVTKPVSGHKSILAARCAFFRRMFLRDPKWQQPTVFINNSRLEPEAFRALCQYIYTNHIDLPSRYWKDFQSLCKQCNMLPLVRQIEESLQQKETSGIEVGEVITFDATDHQLQQQKQNNIQQMAVQSQLQRDFEKVFLRANSELEREFGSLTTSQEEFIDGHNGNSPSAANGNEDEEVEETEEAQLAKSDSARCYWPDVAFRVEGKVFRAHKFLLGGRSEYFYALLSGHFMESESLRRSSSSYAVSSSSSSPSSSLSSSCEKLPQIELSGISAATFWQILHFIYTDNVFRLRDIHDLDQLLDLLEAADMYLLSKLKTSVASMLSVHVEAGNVFEMLVIASRYEGTSQLEQACIRVLALSLSELVHTEGFARVVRESAATIISRQETDSIPIVDEIRSYIQGDILDRLPPFEDGDEEDWNEEGSPAWTRRIWQAKLDELDQVLSNLGLEC